RNSPVAASSAYGLPRYPGVNIMPSTSPGWPEKRSRNRYHSARQILVGPRCPYQYPLGANNTIVYNPFLRSATIQVHGRHLSTVFRLHSLFSPQDSTHWTINSPRMYSIAAGSTMALRLLGSGFSLFLFLVFLDHFQQLRHSAFRVYGVVDICIYFDDTDGRIQTVFQRIDKRLIGHRVPEHLGFLLFVDRIEHRVSLHRDEEPDFSPSGVRLFGENLAHLAIFFRRGPHQRNIWIPLVEQTVFITRIDRFGAPKITHIDAARGD